MSILSKNLIFRAIEDKDLHLMVEWRNNPENNFYFYEYEPLSLPIQKIWYENYLKNVNNDKIFIIDERKSLNTIGMVSIYHIDWRSRKAEWGRVLIIPEYRGKGYGKEIDAATQMYCFETLNLHKVYREVLSINKKAIQLYEKMGCKIEGMLRQHVYRHGEYQDVIIMSILKDEYLELKKKGYYDSYF